MKPHVVLVCPEPIRPLQQGVGIRFREIARELSVHCHVSLWATQVEAGVPLDGFTVRTFPDADFARELKGVDAVVIHGHVSDRYLDALERSGLGGGPPLVVDLYDPFLVENLQYVRDLGADAHKRDLRVVTRQLAAGDLFLVSSESQRLFYAGLMMAAGLFDPASYHADPTLNHLFAVALGVQPAGETHATPLARDGGRRGLEGRRSWIAANDTIAFFGGIYDWYYPEPLIDVVEPLCRAIPAASRAVQRDAQSGTHASGLLHSRAAHAEAKGLAGRHVFFVPWFPYHERDRFLRDVDVAVCLHRPGLEADLSLRTRILEFLRAGLPVIATTGGETSHILNASGAGLLVPPGEIEPLRRALAALLGDSGARARAAPPDASGSAASGRGRGRCGRCSTSAISPASVRRAPRISARFPRAPPAPGPPLPSRAPMTRPTSRSSSRRTIGCRCWRRSSRRWTPRKTRRRSR